MEILQMIKANKLEVIIIALAINILTGLIKMPIKNAAKKMEDKTVVTKWIVFLPIILAAVLSWGYGCIIKKTWGIDEQFFTRWLTSSSLSLSFYALFEKLVPSKKKILEEYEIVENQRLINELKNLTGVEKSNEEPAEVIAETVASETTCPPKTSAEGISSRKRIILKENRQ